MESEQIKIFLITIHIFWPWESGWESAHRHWCESNNPKKKELLRRLSLGYIGLSEKSDSEVKDHALFRETQNTSLCPDRQANLDSPHIYSRFMIVFCRGYPKKKNIKVTKIRDYYSIEALDVKSESKFVFYAQHYPRAPFYMILRGYSCASQNSGSGRPNFAGL